MQKVKIPRIRLMVRRLQGRFCRPCRVPLTRFKTVNESPLCISYAGLAIQKTCKKYLLYQKIVVVNNDIAMLISYHWHTMILPAMLYSSPTFRLNNSWENLLNIPLLASDMRNLIKTPRMPWRNVFVMFPSRCGCWGCSWGCAPDVFTVTLRGTSVDFFKSRNREKGRVERNPYFWAWKSKANFFTGWND